MSDVERLYAERRGQMPTWFRRRDAQAELVGSIGGHRRSDRTLRRLSFVVDQGCAELVAAMDARQITIAAAYELAHLSAEMQRKCLADPALRKRAVRVLRNGASA